MAHLIEKEMIKVQVKVTRMKIWYYLLQRAEQIAGTQGDLSIMQISEVLSLLAQALPLLSEKSLVP